MFVSVGARDHDRATLNLSRDWTDKRQAWDDYIRQHARGSVFHTSTMVQVFAAAKGHSVLPIASFDPSGRINALLVAVQVQTLPDPFGRVSSRSILYAEPLCDDSPEGVDALARLIQRHDRYMRQRVVFAEVRQAAAPGPERDALERCGYEFENHLNYVLDLTSDESVLWESLSNSARRGVKKGVRRGFEFREVGLADDVHELYRFLELTYGRSRVPLADRSLFDAAFAELHPSGMCRIYATYSDSKPVAMDMVLIYKGNMLAWYGGLERMRGLSPFDFLQWHEILTAKRFGCTVYDFGGAGRPDVKYGVRDFKAKFGGRLVDHGRFRKVFAPWKLRLAEHAYRWSRGMLAP
jgi:CelD/BcsL family acetyltransferase involved in cellulose biosynthesis